MFSSALILPRLLRWRWMNEEKTVMFLIATFCVIKAG